MADNDNNGKPNLATPDDLGSFVAGMIDDCEFWGLDQALDESQPPSQTMHRVKAVYPYRGVGFSNDILVLLTNGQRFRILILDEGPVTWPEPPQETP
jgi:hypothetical protein